MDGEEFAYKPLFFTADAGWSCLVAFLVADPERISLYFSGQHATNIEALMEDF